MRLRTITTALALACCLGASLNAAAADVKSISRLAAGPGNILFVADWKAARVHAISLPATQQQPAGTAFNILDLESLLSAQVGGARVTVEDMVVRPGTAQVYVAVSYGAAKTPALILVTSDKKARRIDLKAAASTSVALRDAPTSDYSFWKETPERSFTVTDMKWREGELFVAGLSNQDFASTLRRVKYPFDAKQSVTSVEIYHAGHNLIETRAPIRAMSFASWGGKPYLVAAYTCTPLVTIPLDDLKDGAHIRGKTVAELGYGNTPADMIAYSRTEQGKTEDFLLLANFDRVSNVIPVSQLEATGSRPGIEKQVPFGQLAGVEVIQAPLAGTLRLDNLDEKSFVVVRRRLEKDALQLVSIGKELSFRLTDHVSEYAFAEYSFKGDNFQLQNIKPRQDMLLKDEGFPDLIKASE
ncbi:hypothetical protein J2W32_000059 [Variovorax boronicumulans]|uniref:Amine dehydrogenase n=1 Tax=Variovorax boronicumulans TaxID=436515 RepID=A0AAW8CR00_9BURK|nr:hypothetical protein [Variovorax boronicumulans]MDP9890963.1 hypothetical protein [Variovorax boronicumulans]MDQ0051030.1 hypothetical protein [Variovorax boronicumulans]